MNPGNNNVEEILNRFLPVPSQDVIESDCDRILNRLRWSAADRSQAEPVAEPCPGPVFVWRRIAMAAAAVMAVLLGSGIVWWQGRPFAVVESVDGSLSRILGGKAHAIPNGAVIEAGEAVRADSNAGAMLKLADGSRVEMRAQSELSLERAEDGVLIRLAKGGIIVNAAKQHGHLYVQTKDLTVSVVGTVFVVSAAEAGSRVAVLEGEVRVEQGAMFKKLLPGEQVATNPLMEPHPIVRDVSWSRRAEMYLSELQQVAPAAAPPKRLEFEVASIRPELPEGGNQTFPVPLRCSGADGILELLDPGQAVIRDAFPNSQWTQASTVPRGHCIGRYTAMADLIGLAYGLKSASLLRPSLLGGEQWMYDSRDSFQIDAKAENPATVTRSQLQQMLQSLLADRFKLKVSWHAKELQGYVMYTARDGAKLPMASSEEALKQVTRNVGDTVQRVITGNASVEAFLDFISIRSPLMAAGGGDKTNTILDRTGLKGTYSFNLSYTVPPSAPSGVEGQRGAQNRVEGYSPAFPNLRDALQEQLGLRLETSKVPTDFVVIDYAEKPSEN